MVAGRLGNREVINIGFRVDSSFQIGTGHVMRCLTLAESLKGKLNAVVYFFCRASDGNINAQIVKKGFHLVEMEAPVEVVKGELAHSSWLGATQENDAHEFLNLTESNQIKKFDLIVTDHYAIDENWHKVIRPLTKKVFVIDDLGDRKHDCDYLLDQTFNCAEGKYKGLVPENCTLMLGTKYALLRKEFIVSDNVSKKRRKFDDKKNILIMLGGADPDNLTLKILKLVINRKDIEEISVVVSEKIKYLNEVKSYCLNLFKVKLYVSPKNIAEIMRCSFLAIGAAGSTSWERCSQGLPAILVIQALNQRQIARELEKSGVCTVMELEHIDEQLNLQLDKWFCSKDKYEYAVESCKLICDAKGVERVSEVLKYV